MLIYDKENEIKEKIEPRIKLNYNIPYYRNLTLVLIKVFEINVT